MKFNSEITIDLPRDRVLELFDNAENMAKWQPTLLHYEFLEGTPGQVGGKMKLAYKMGKGTLEMVETIVRRDLPDHFDCTYDAKGVHNIVRNQFLESNGKTVWKSENEFQFKGFMKLMGMIMPGAFKKESDKIMQNFKAFAEREGPN